MLMPMPEQSPRFAGIGSPTEFLFASFRGLQSVVLQNSTLRATLLPELGGKLASLVSLKTGREFLLQPQDHPYTRALYGDAFASRDTSGFDECFPTVSACRYPGTHFTGVALPDHGELWSVPWECEIRGRGIRMKGSGIHLPYVLRKTFTLAGSVLRLEYELLNISDEPIAYLYSSHPLLAVEAGATVVLPSEVSELYVHSSSDELLGRPGAPCAWPQAEAAGVKVQLDTLVGREVNTAHKLFTQRLTTGACGIHFPRTAEALVYRFDPDELPYVGVWLCQGGWPARVDGHFTAALEPCSGRPDSLAEAFSCNQHRTLPPRGVHHWWLELHVKNDCNRLAF